MEKQILGTTNRTCLTSASFPGWQGRCFQKLNYWILPYIQKPHLQIKQWNVYCSWKFDPSALRCTLLIAINSWIHSLSSAMMFSPQTSKKTQHECRGPTNGSMYVFCFTRKSWGPPPALRATPASGGYVLCERFAPPPETFPPAGQLTFPLWRGWSDEGGPGRTLPDER